jgi:hypothetical protein
VVFTFDKISLAEFLWQNFFDKIFLSKFLFQNFFGKISFLKFLWQNFFGKKCQQQRLKAEANSTSFRALQRWDCVRKLVLLLSALSVTKFIKTDTGNTKGSITVQLTSCLTGLD